MDIMLFLIKAFVYNKQIWPDIDRFYQSNKYEFYSAAKDGFKQNIETLTADTMKLAFGRDDRM